MKPAWDKLMDKFKDSEEVLIADVDCTAAGKDLCDTHGVRGFPTIKYGNPSDLEDYEGGRSFEDLSTFAEANIGKQNLVEGTAMDKAVKKVQKFFKKNVYPMFSNVQLIFARVPDAAIFVTVVSLFCGICIGIPIGSSFFGSPQAPRKTQDEKKNK